MRQIGVFRPSKIDSTRLRHCGLSWIVPNGRAAHFLSWIEAGRSVKKCTLTIHKNQSKGIWQYSRFSILHFKTLKDKVGTILDHCFIMIYQFYQKFSTIQKNTRQLNSYIGACTNPSNFMHVFRANHVRNRLTVFFSSERSKNEENNARLTF